ncbi:OmpA family protein [Galbibacter sp. EGI 63066]|uniref:OmpA family protein n=1 Tax=Galbibacter sp. EGI 63066 TaxID=2993559 RepID=UPI002249350B|nr:OmpA family protein [Galbibacter sp. EGI 63066]MCX2681981.1 OmpA family protein [Galbibacter sp. EGI 63066]
MERKGIIVFLLFILMCHPLIAQEQEEHTIKKLSVNSRQSDFGVSFKGNNAVVFASSRKWKGDRTKIWRGNGQPYLDLYIGEIAPDKDIQNVKKFGGRFINTKYHESNAVFTRDSSTVYFSRNNYLRNKYHKDSTGYNLIQMYKARVGQNGEWVDIEPMPFNSDDYQTGHPALNIAEDKLYFTSDMPGTYGETDIFVVNIKEDGTYGQPKNLGPEVNTPKREMFPFVDEDNFLYFSSEGFSDGKGGLDIYVSKLEGDQAVGLVTNVGEPVNSADDDFCIVMKPGEDWGYFSSDRHRRNVDDIYYFEFYDGFKDNINMEAACVNVFDGIVREEGTGALLPGALVTVYDGSGNMIESTRANDFAKYALRLPCGDETFRVVASKQNYHDDSDTFKNLNTRVPGGVNLASLNLELSLKPEDFVRGYGDYLMVDNLNPIYFNLDKSDIRPDAAVELEKVIRIMKKYPEIEIEVAAHTDSRANDGYNMKLSERRATSTKNWLIERGISSSRISGSGYGETHLVNSCGNGVRCSEAEHQLNRRTEFVVKNPEVIRKSTEE